MSNVLKKENGFRLELENGSPLLLQDATDTYTKLLLHCNGTNGSTVFTDSSASGHAVTANGDAKISTAQYEFGGASGLFGGNDYLSVLDSPDWDLGTGDFTFECWANFSSTATVQTIFGREQDISNRMAFLWHTSNGLSFEAKISGGWSTDTYRAWTPTTGVWYHLAAVRYGSAIKLFVNGTQLGSDGSIDSASLDMTAALTVGRYWMDLPGGEFYFNGYIDEVRVSKEIARWTANFTPSTAEY
jgi:hypothetical protein